MSKLDFIELSFLREFNLDLSSLTALKIHLQSKNFQEKVPEPSPRLYPQPPSSASTSYRG